MEVGTELNIQIKGANTRFKSELLGKDEGQYLILRMPTLASLGEATSSLFRGNEIIVRYVHKGTAFGFQSRIKYVIFNPIKLVFIEFPKKFENLDIRKKRVDCFLPANIKVSEAIIEGYITNISNDGCQFNVETSNLGNNINNLQVDKKINIGFQLPGVEKELLVTALQKNVKKNAKNVSMGLVFEDMDDDVKVKFQDFYSRAIKEL